VPNGVGVHIVFLSGLEILCILLGSVRNDKFLDMSSNIFVICNSSTMHGTNVNLGMRARVGLYS